MNTTRVLYHLLRADFFERTRRYSFLLTLGFVVYFAYLFVPPNHARYATLQMAGHRGVYNSAWLGTQVAMLATLFLSLAGFYLVKNTISRDRQTGVGQILAATPMRKTLYVLGKTLSNFAVLAVMVLALICATAIMQLVRAEDMQIDFITLASPFLFLTLPALAVIAALAVLFESVRVLRAGLGNVVFYFLWTMIIALDVREGGNVDLLLGFKTPLQSMQAATAQAFPEYDAEKSRFSMGFNFKANDERWHLTTFVWEGVAWTPSLLFKRLACIALALGLGLLAAFCFDRFDAAAKAKALGGKKKKRLVNGETERIDSEQEVLSPQSISEEEYMLDTIPPLRGVRGVLLKSNTTPDFVNDPERHPPSPPQGGNYSALVHLTPLASITARYNFGRVLLAELKLMLKGVSRWWQLVALGLIIASAFVPMNVARQFMFPFAWIWPLLLWSPMGTRESLHRTHQLVFSAPRVLQTQLPAAWLAGVIVALIMASGFLLRTLFTGEGQLFSAVLVGAFFIPTLALTFGVWSGSSKLFEIIYLMLWYGGPMNRIPFLDFLGATDEALLLGMPKIFLMITLALLALMFWGRRMQMSRL